MSRRDVTVVVGDEVVIGGVAVQVSTETSIGGVAVQVSTETSVGVPGVGVPAGGVPGQVVGKLGVDDYDTGWVDQTGGGGGQVDSVGAGAGISVNSSVASAPVVSLDSGAVASLGKADTALQADDGFAALDSAAASKLGGIEEGAEVNVQSDWSAPSGDAHILNKPTLGTAAAANATDFAAASHVGAGGTAHAVAVASGDAGFLSGADKAKLDGIEAGADVTDATNVAAAGAIMQSTEDDNTALRVWAGVESDLPAEPRDAGTLYFTVED